MLQLDGVLKPKGLPFMAPFWHRNEGNLWRVVRVGLAHHIFRVVTAGILEGSGHTLSECPREMYQTTPSTLGFPIYTQCLKMQHRSRISQLSSLLKEWV